MDFDKFDDGEEEAEEESGGHMGCLGKLFLLFFIFLVLVIGSAAMLPSFLNSEKGKAWALGKANASLAPGRLSFESWTVSWFAPTEIRRVSFSRPDGLDIQAESVSSSSGLLHLLPVGALNLGAVIVKKPVCTVKPPAKQPSPKPGEQAPGGSFFLPVVDFSAALTVEDGSVNIFSGSADAALFTARQLAAKLTIPSYRKPIPVELSFWTGKNGRLTMNGTVQSLEEMNSGKRFESPRQLTLAVSSLGVSDLAGLFNADIGVASGVADGTMTVGLLSAQSFTLAGDLKIAKFSVSGEKKTHSQASDLSLAVNAGFDAGNVRIEKLNVVSPWLNVQGKGMLAPQQKGQMAGSLQVKADVNLTRFYRDFKRVLKSAPPMVGTVSFDLSTRQYAEQIGVSSVVKLTDFAAALAKGQTTVIPKGTLKFDGMVPFKDGRLLEEIHDATWSLTAANDTFSGGFTRWAWREKQPVLRGLSVKVDADIASALRLLGGFIPPDAVRDIKSISGHVTASATAEAALGQFKAKVSIGGQQLYGKKANGITDVPLNGCEGSFSMPTGGGSFQAKGTANGSARLGPVAVYGLYAGPAEVKARYSMGLLQLEYAPNLNGGKLRFTPDVHFEGAKTMVRSPAKTRILENVAITQEMVDAWLVAINPFFERSRIKGGTITADVNRFQLDTSLPPEKGLNAEFDLLFKDVQLILGPAFDEMLEALSVNNRLYKVESLPMRVTIQNGLVYMGKTRFVLDGQPISIIGWSAFDGRIRYDIEVPLTERLFAKWGVKSVGKLFEGKTVVIHLTGTADNPKIDLGGMAKGLNSLMKKGTDLMDMGTDLFEQLKKEISK